MAKRARIFSSQPVDSKAKQKKVKSASLPPIDKKQFEQILDCIYEINPIAYQTLYMQALTGLRYSDASMLIWSDFFDGESLRSSFILIQQKVFRMVFSRLIKKGVIEKIATREAIKKAKVTIYINARMKVLLTEIEIFNPKITGEEYLFANKHKASKGNPLDIRSVNKILTRVKQKLGLNYTLGTHSFRKFLAMNLLQAGANVAEIRDLLGHNNVASTDKYLTSFSSKLGDLVEKLDY